MSPAPPEEIVEAWDLADGVSAMLTKLIRGAEATPEMGVHGTLAVGGAL